MINFGQKLRYLRKSKSLSMRELSKLSGVSTPYICCLENQKNSMPSAEKLHALCNVLGVDIMFFLSTETVLPEYSHVDKAFFDKYQLLDADAKNKMHKILDIYFMDKNGTQTNPQS